MAFSLTISKLQRAIATGFVCLATIVAASTTVRADVIDVDYSSVTDPRVRDAYATAEAFWESRIQNYSTAMPKAILVQLTKLRIIALLDVIDGPGQILGQAGPDAFLTYQSGNLFEPRTFAFPTNATMTLDIEDVDFMAANDLLERVTIHEMGHALGFGPLWTQNGLVGPLAGVGLTQYIGGEYAIKGYRQDTGSPVLNFVPVEQGGGAGTAGAHWAAVGVFDQILTPAFKHDIMVGVLGRVDPASGAIVFGNAFTTNATWGGMADLGWEVEGVNDNAVDPPAGQGTGRWPKRTGSGVDPFGDNEVPVAAGVNFRLQKVRNSIKLVGGNNDGNNSDTGTTDDEDPYRLRDKRWINKGNVK